MKSKNVLLTFDYEPYLGTKSGTAIKCLIEPTNILKSILNKHNAKGVFFVDILYILNLKKQNLQSDFDVVTNQIKQLYQNGHYIFPHLHPHWLDAKYLHEVRQFDLSNLEKYSLSSLNGNQIEGLFAQSFYLFKELGITYDVWGYRAGGWCIQPFSNYVEIFKHYNIKYEFSVLPNYKNEKPEQFFDFSSVTKKTPYYFQNNIVIEDEKGMFTEFPISTVEISNTTNFLSRVVNKCLWKINDKGFGDGIGAQTSALQTTLKNSEMISVDVLNVAKLTSYKIFLSKNDYMHWISHPKMFTHHGLKTFDSFLKYARSNFEIKYNSFVL